MSACFNVSEKTPDNINEKPFKNGAHESLQFLRTFDGMSLLIPVFLGFKKTYLPNYMIYFNFLKRKSIVKVTYFFSY